MTQEEFSEFIKNLYDYEDFTYACECWDSLTDEEKAKYTIEDVFTDIQATYEAVAEEEEC